VALKDQQTALRHAQTKIRLLAPTTTVDEAQKLRMTIRKLTDAVGPDLDRPGWDLLTRNVARQREVFLAEAKKAMSLPK
jgi:hypothetical protein